MGQNPLQSPLLRQRLGQSLHQKEVKHIHKSEMVHSNAMQKQKKNNTMVRMVAIKRIPNSSRNLPWNNLLSCIGGKKVPDNPYRTQIEKKELGIKTELGKTIFIAFDNYIILIKQ